MSTVTRTRLRDQLHVGLRVIHTDELHIWDVAQVWRADQEVLLIAHDTGERRRVSWAELTHHYELVQPFSGGPR
jgi:hypothetical protein